MPLRVCVVEGGMGRRGGHESRNDGAWALPTVTLREGNLSWVSWLLSRPLDGHAPSQSPSGLSLETNITVSQKRPKSWPGGTLLLSLRGRRQGEIAKLLEFYSAWEPLQKFHQAGPTGEAGRHLQSLDYFPSHLLSLFIFVILCQGCWQIFS